MHRVSRLFLIIILNKYIFQCSLYKAAMRVECTNYISNNDNKNTLFTTINKVFTAVYTFLSSISDAHGFVLVGRESNNNI